MGKGFAFSHFYCQNSTNIHKWVYRRTRKTFYNIVKIGNYWRMFITLEHNSISQRLVSYRQQLGKSQAEMSREFGVNQSHYSKLESGTKYISYSSLKKFEKAGGDVNYLVTGVHYKTGIVEDCMKRCRTSDGKNRINEGIILADQTGNYADARRKLERGKSESVEVYPAC